MPTALLSVHDTSGIGPFAQHLQRLGFDLLGFASTVKAVRSYNADLPIRDVAEIVGDIPNLGHSVAGLSVQLHAALMADLDNPADLAALESHGIAPIHLVCIDLNRLDEEITTAGPNDFQAVLAKIDNAGPALIRSAAIGRRIVICGEGQRLKVLSWLKAGRPDNDRFLAALAAKAEMQVSLYSMVANEFWHQVYSGILFSPTSQNATPGGNWPQQQHLTVDWLDGSMPTSVPVDPTFVVNGPVPVHLIRKHRLLPLHRDGKAMVIAMDDPTDIIALDDLRMSGLSVRGVLAPRQRIEEILAQLFPPDSPH